jgi:deoxyribonuclease-4
MVRIGTHTSIAGGIELAFQRSAEVGWNTLQIFAKSPRGRAYPTYTQEQYALGRTARKQAQQLWGLVHSNYLINLSKPHDEAKAEIASVLHDFEVAHALWYEAVNVHIGKEKWRTSKQEAMQLMTKNVGYILEMVHKKWRGDVTFLFENTAWQGSEIGSNVAELGMFVKDFLHDMPVKFCIDTAHCRWGGIDLAQRDACEEQFAQSIGIDRLYAIHLNDAKVPLGAHLDRHASLWQGFIGWPVLSKVIAWAAKHDKPLFIETPEPDLRPDEINKVKSIVAGDLKRIDAEHKNVFQQQALKKYATPTGLFA